MHRAAATLKRTGDHRYVVYFESDGGVIARDVPPDKAVMCLARLGRGAPGLLAALGFRDTAAGIIRRKLKLPRP